MSSEEVAYGKHRIDVMLTATDLEAVRHFNGEGSGSTSSSNDEFITFACGDDRRRVVTRTTKAPNETIGSRMG